MLIGFPSFCFLLSLLFFPGSYFNSPKVNGLLFLALKDFWADLLSEIIPWGFRSGRAECLVRELMAFFFFYTDAFYLGQWELIKHHGPATYIAYISFFAFTSVPSPFLLPRFGPCLGNSHHFDVVEFTVLFYLIHGGSAGL